VKVEDKVRKIGGDYTFEGVVVAVFEKLSGKVRVVVEDDRGVLHIFSERQLVTGWVRRGRCESPL